MIELTATENTQGNRDRDPPTLVQEVSSFSVANISLKKEIGVVGPSHIRPYLHKKPTELPC